MCYCVNNGSIFDKSYVRRNEICIDNMQNRNKNKTKFKKYILNFRIYIIYVHINNSMYLSFISIEYILRVIPKD